MIRNSILSAVILLIASARLVSGAESDIEVRLVAERLPNNLGEVVLASGELRSKPFNLPMNNLSAPQKAPARAFSLLSLEQRVSLANIMLPKEGNSFVVLLIPTSREGYTPVVMAYNNPGFRGGDIYFYNNSKNMVFGIVGTSKFKIDPAESTVLRPTGARKERFYDVSLGVRVANENRVLRTTRWPEDKNTRYYVFFYTNPKTGRVTYRAVDEFIMPTKSQ